jgi:hypothetical protein
MKPALIYSIKDNNGFFRGAPPLNETQQDILQKTFPQYILPNDYLAFLQIHNGFCKTTDCTGVICSSKMLETYERFQEQLQSQEPIQTSTGAIVESKNTHSFL